MHTVFPIVGAVLVVVAGKWLMGRSGGGDGGGDAEGKPA